MGLTKEQLELRKSGIFASEIAGLTGHSPWLSPHDLFNSKVYGVEKPKSFAMKMGDLLEDDILSLYVEETHAQLAFPGTVLHPEKAYLGCTPDGVADGSRVVQAKTASPWDREHWGEPMTDGIPPQYLVQVQFEMLVLGKRVCDVPVLFGTQEFQVFRVEYDAELGESLAEIARRFYFEHVATKTPPPLDWTTACSVGLAHRYPLDRAPLVASTPEVDFGIRQIGGFMRAKREAEQGLNHHRNRLRAFIGEAAGVQGDGFVATWKADKNGKRSLRIKFDGEEQDNE